MILIVSGVELQAVILGVNNSVIISVVSDHILIDFLILNHYCFAILILLRLYYVVLLISYTILNWILDSRQSRITSHILFNR